MATLDTPGANWKWTALSYNPSMAVPEFIIVNLDKPWHWGSGGLSSNPSITLEFILDNIDKPWHWGAISYNPSMAVTELITATINKPWDWGSEGGLSSNPMNGPNYPKEIKELEKLYKIQKLSFDEYRQLESINNSLIKWLNRIYKNWKNTDFQHKVKDHFYKSLELLEYYSNIYITDDVMEYYPNHL